MKQVVKNAVVAIVGTNFEGKKSRIHLCTLGMMAKCAAHSTTASAENAFTVTCILLAS